MKYTIVAILTLVVCGVVNAGWYDYNDVYSHELYNYSTCNNETHVRSYSVYIPTDYIGENYINYAMVVFHPEHISDPKQWVEDINLDAKTEGLGIDEQFMIIVPYGLYDSGENKYNWEYLNDEGGASDLLMLEMEAHYAFIEYMIDDIDTDATIPTLTDWYDEYVIALGAECGAYLVHQMSLEYDSTNPNLLPFHIATILIWNGWVDEELQSMYQGWTHTATVRPVMVYHDADYFSETDEIHAIVDPDSYDYPYEELRKRNKHYTRARNSCLFWKFLNGLDATDVVGTLYEYPLANKIVITEIWNDASHHKVKFMGGWTGMPSDWPGITGTTLTDLFWNFVYNELINGVVVASEPGASQSFRIDGSCTNSFHLDALFPNPFNSSTKLQIYLKESQDLEIRLVNSLGRIIQTSTHRDLSAGSHEFQVDAQDLASGLYFVSIRSNLGYNEVRKIALIR